MEVPQFQLNVLGHAAFLMSLVMFLRLKKFKASLDCPI